MRIKAIAPWCSSADLKAATSAGLAGLRPEFMPGTESASSSAHVDWLRVLPRPERGGFVVRPDPISSSIMRIAAAVRARQYEEHAMDLARGVR